jgi:tetratricopeptide (TPR) repeat protein
VPGILLSIFGLRALLQERRLADQQIQERLAATAEAAARRLEWELMEWQQAAAQLAPAAGWPARVRAAMAEPGFVVVLLGDKRQPQALPPGHLLYSLSPAAAPDLPSLDEVESLELRAKDYEQAIAQYRRALAAARPPDRAILLNRLARSLKKAGQLDEAIETFRLLAKEPSVRIGSLPSDLLALHEISSPELYRELVSGRWQLQKSSYLFYSQAARQMLPQSDAAAELERIEQRKLALTSAAERFLEESPAARLP